MNVSSAKGLPEWPGFAVAYHMGPVVQKLVSSVLQLVTSHFEARHVYYAAGNHDGPSLAPRTRGGHSKQQILEYGIGDMSPIFHTSSAICRRIVSSAV